MFLSHVVSLNAIANVCNHLLAFISLRGRNRLRLLCKLSKIYIGGGVWNLQTYGGGVSVNVGWGVCERSYMWGGGYLLVWIAVQVAEGGPNWESGGWGCLSVRLYESQPISPPRCLNSRRHRVARHTTHRHAPRHATHCIMCHALGRCIDDREGLCIEDRCACHWLDVVQQFDVPC